MNIFLIMMILGYGLIVVAHCRCWSGAGPLMLFLKGDDTKQFLSQRTVFSIILVSLALLVMSLAFRPDTVGSDTSEYGLIAATGDVAQSSSEVGSRLLFYLSDRLTGISTLFGGFALLFLGGYFWALKRLLGMRAALLALMILVSSFIFWQLGTNVIRQGAAFGIGLHSLVFLWRRQLKAFFVCVVLAACFHASALMLLLAPLSLFFKRSFALAFWVGVAILSAVGIPDVFLNYVERALGLLKATRATGYLDARGLYYHGEYNVGFKLRFVVFSALPILVCLLMSAPASLRRFRDEALRNYLFLNAGAMLFFSMPYHDRLFYWSWPLMPLMIGITGLYNKKRYYFFWVLALAMGVYQIIFQF